jgi:hypothetical protein
MGTSWGLVCLERDELTSRFFETLKSKHDDERETVRRYVEAHERRLRGSTEPRPRRGRPRRGERYERIGQQIPGNSGLLGTDSPDAQILVVGLVRELSWPTPSPTTKTARRAGPVERRSRYRGGKTSESENPRALPA